MARPRKYSVDRAIYLTWRNMRDRCRNPQNAGYKNYGGRGIDVCDTWFDDVEKFASDMGPKPSPLHTLERKNNDGNYEPSNCKWGTRSEQSFNQRKTTKVFVTWRGQTKSAAEWAALFGITAATLRLRLSRGWSIDDALAPPSASGPRVYKKKRALARAVA